MRSRTGSVPKWNAASHAVVIGTVDAWTSTVFDSPGMPGHVVEYVQSKDLVMDRGCEEEADGEEDRARCRDSPHFLA